MTPALWILSDARLADMSGDGHCQARTRQWTGHPDLEPRLDSGHVFLWPSAHRMLQLALLPLHIS